MNTKSDAKYFYERILPFVTAMPMLSAFQIGTALQTIQPDFSDVPMGGDSSLVNCVLECLRFVGRKAGLSVETAAHIPMLIRVNMLKITLNDLMVVKNISMTEVEVVRMAARSTALSVGMQARNYSTATLTAAQLIEIEQLVLSVDQRISIFDETLVPLAQYGNALDEKLSGVCDWSLFGRLRRDMSVEGLAGTAPVPPISRPIEMTLVPDKVVHFLDVTKAMRHCLNLCVLLANQRKIVRNSYTLRLCLIEHLFVRVIPLPLPVNHPQRDTLCFWHAQPMRYETQADILRLLNMLCRHFATVSLSVKSTRSGDAVRMLVFACMATVCDATLRKIACDVPSQSSLHYSGKAKGPLQPFGFDLGNFAEESEYLKFNSPETAAARAQVLDYFYQLNKEVPHENCMFRYQDGNMCSSADKRFMDQLCLQMGFDRNCECAFITGASPILLDHYPEIGFFRDLVFMFKLVMVPTSDKLPELKAWTPEEAALIWSIDGEGYCIRGFAKLLDATNIVSVEEEQVQRATKSGMISRVLKFVGIKGKLPRATPSQANPSILLGERVDTEDDILHIRTLPDFDGSLGARDCELMLQYLTAPYMRIPLLLKFFSSEARLRALRTLAIQEVLDAALFEPGQWQSAMEKSCPDMVPAPSRDHMCTSAGLLFNELVMSPSIVLSSVQQMLEKVLEMDTGKYSELSESILFVVRLVVRLESYIIFLVTNRAFHQSNRNAPEGVRTKYNGAYFESEVRGLECDDATLEEAMACQRQLRTILHDKVFKMIARWINKAKEEGRSSTACMLHAHLAYLFRNIQAEELTPTIVFASMASQIFLFNNYRYDLDLEQNDKKAKKSRVDSEDIQMDLRISQVDLFDMFQINRNKIMTWLLAEPDQRNAVRVHFRSSTCLLG